MPKPLAFGANLGLLARMAAQMLMRLRYRGSKSRHTMAIDTLEQRTFLSATYFVANWGSDQGPGTSNQPYRTIQEAANVANWGDTVDIFGGTYRETVTPPHSGVTFTNFGGQTVVVDGANVVSGWTPAGGATYTTSMPVDLGEGSNQVFVDGRMVNEAQWPNPGTDISHPVEATVGSYSNGTIYDQQITQGNGYWNGATIHVTPGSAWVGYTGVVTNSGPGWLQISLPSLSGYETPTSGNQFYLSGTRNALTSPGQWYAANGTLSLWDPSSDYPGAHTVEVKERQYAFNLNSVTNTTIQGLNIFASTITTGWGSQNTTINSINAEYLSQFNNAWNSGWAPPSDSGIALNGSGSILENSTIAFSAGDGAYIGNSGIRVTNNIIHDVDYSGTDAAGVRDYGSNAQIDNNTIYNTGRDGINFQASGVSVLSNTVHDAMIQTNDGGGIYTVSNTGGGTIAYNTVYNILTAYNVAGGQYGATGIFLDNNSGNFSVHDNVTANVDSGMRMNFASYNENIYNNQLGGIYYAIDGNGGNWSGTQIYNNGFYNPNVALGNGAAAWNNYTAGGSPALPGATTNFVPSPPPPPPVVVASPPPPPAPVVSPPPPAPVSVPAATPVPTPVASSGGSSSSNSSSGKSSSGGSSAQSSGATSSSAPASPIPSAAPSVFSAVKVIPKAIALVGPKMPKSHKTGATAKPTTTTTSKPTTSTEPTTTTSVTKPTSTTKPTTSTAKTTGVTISAITTTIIAAKPKITVKPAVTAKPSVTGKPAAPKTVTVPLSGSISGTYRVKPKLGKTAGGYALTGKGTLSTIKISTAVAKSLGVVENGKATGIVTLVTPKGNIDLSLTSPAPASASTVPTSYSYVVKPGTGSYKNATGQGTVNLTVTPSKKGKFGTFTLAFK